MKSRALTAAIAVAMLPLSACSDKSAERMEAAANSLGNDLNTGADQLGSSLDNGLDKAGSAIDRAGNDIAAETEGARRSVGNSLNDIGNDLRR